MAGQFEICEIEIRNWPKYQAEGVKYESTSWYRQQNTVWQHAIFQLLTGDEYKVKVFLDCLVSQTGHKSGKASLDIALCARFCGVPISTVYSTLEKLSGLRIGYLTYAPACVDETAANSPGADLVHAPSEPGADSVHTSRYVTERNVTKEELKGDAPASPQSGQLALVPETPNPTALAPPGAKGPARYTGRPKDEQAFVGAYVRAYRGRYGPGLRPECLDDGKTIGLVRSFLKSRPLERACDLIQVYLQMDDRRFVDAKHDIVTFTQRINQIGLALHNGRDPSKPLTFAEYMQRKEATNEVVRGSVGIQRTD